MSDRYAQDDERRAGIDDAITRRQQQSDAGEFDREQDDPAGRNTTSGKADRESVEGGHGHGGELDLQLDKEPAEGRRDIGG